MKKLIMFFAGLALLLVTGAGLYFAGALYDAGDKFTVQPFIFQPNNLSAARIGTPLSIDQLSADTILETLIKKFVTEYFYITPDAEDIAQRTRRGSILSMLSSPDVFNEWKNDQAPVIERLADAHVLRTVHVADEILKPTGSDYWTVVYELKTWDTPNDMAARPTTTRGVIYLQVRFEKELRDTMQGKPFDVREYLDRGGDPAAIFKFRVERVAQNLN